LIGRVSLKFIIGPAHRVRPLAGPMAGSARTRWLNPGYICYTRLTLKLKSTSEPDS